MPTVEARRTLVKSAPELWAELSDAEALGRRLEALGEIRITRLDPQTTVAWEGERASGTVTIEPAGFGTRVTLTAESSRQQPAPEPVQPPSPAVADPPSPPVEPAVPQPVVESPERPHDAGPTFPPLSWPPPAAPRVEREPEAESEPDLDAQPETEPQPEVGSAPKLDPELEAVTEPDDAPPDPLGTPPLDQGFDVPAPQPPSRRPAGPWSLIQRLARRRRWDAGAQVPEAPGPAAAEPESSAEPEEPTHTPVADPPGLDELDAVGKLTVADRRGAPDEPAPVAVGPEPVADEADLDPADPDLDAADPEAIAGEPGADDPPADRDEPGADDHEPEADASGLDAEALDGLLAGVLDDLGAAHHRPFSRG